MKFVYIAEKTIYITNKKGDTKVIPVGTQLSAKEYRDLPSESAKAKCREEVFEYAPKQKFSGKELDVAIEVYLKYTVGDSSAVHNPTAVSEVLAVFPKRSYSSINMLLTQIRGLDAYVTQEGLSCQSKALVKKLFAVDPDRFPAGVKFEAKSLEMLDSLLADIRG